MREDHRAMLIVEEDPATMLEAVSAGAAGSWQMTNLGPRIVKRDFAPGFKAARMPASMRTGSENSW